MIKEKTGYVSIDKPHLKYYRKDPIRVFDPNQTLYEQVVAMNEETMDYTAIGYLGERWNYTKLINEVDRTASAYINMGIKEGDVVALTMINTPEAAVNLLALNKIGAQSKWLDVRASGDHLAHYLNEHDCEIIVSLDLVASKVDEIIHKTNIKQVLTVSPADSLNALKRVAYAIKTKLEKKEKYEFQSNKFMKFKDFVNSYESDTLIKPVTFDKERPSVIIQSSGTTGMAKSIVHGDYAFTKVMESVSTSDLPLYPKKKLLVVVPPFVAYGLSNSMYTAFAYSMQAELVPKFDPDIVFKYLGKFNMSFAAPYHYRYIADNIDKVNPKHLEMIDTLISGGDKITVEELEHLYSILKTQIINGYGNNEGAGVVTFNPVKHNKFGTVGIPKPGDEVIIYDSETNQELKYNEVGEVCYSSEVMFLEYANNPEETARIKKLHDDGKYWVHTADYGRIDEDGYLTLVGRMTRVIIRQAFKISPLDIEDVISSHPNVKECITVEAPDKAEKHVPMSFYTLKDGIMDEDKVFKEIEELCYQKLKSYQVPKYFKQLDEMPYTDNNKYDFKALERLAEEHVLEVAPKVLVRE